MAKRFPQRETHCNHMNETLLPAQLAKGALRRLAVAKTEPTPANFARAYAEEAREPGAAEGASGLPMAALPWAHLIERIVRGLERGHPNWTMARKKQSLERVLSANRGDPVNLHQRLSGLSSAWESQWLEEPSADQFDLQDENAQVPAAAIADATFVAMREAAAHVVEALARTVQAGLPGDESRARELAAELGALTDSLVRDGPSPTWCEAMGLVCLSVRRVFGQRNELVDELMALCRALTESLTDLAEEQSWAQGQSVRIRERLEVADGARAVRAVREVLNETQARQRTVRVQQVQAREALKHAISQMLVELGELDTATGQFSAQVKGYAQTVDAADSLESLTVVVRSMITDSQTVHHMVNAARERIAHEHYQAQSLQTKVRSLEGELQRMSEEAVTDSLTQASNRRGLAKLFAAEKARVERQGIANAPMAIALLDIDNFKRLNDSLGHSAGDEALQTLVARVKEWLRPTDHVARFGGEEFVVLLPGSDGPSGSTVLSRLQRRLSASLFMHAGKEVFVTFSAGVTAWRLGETLEQALKRADEALYEAKQTGKNRTCVC
jgi:diguanylate cyclase